MKKLLCVLSAVVAMASTPAMAETVTTTGTINYNQKGSLTIQKLRSEDGQSKTGTATDTEWSDVASEVIEDVTFRYLKVGNMENYTANGKQMLVYSLKDDFVDTVEEITGKTMAIVNGDSKSPLYTSEVINQALQDVLKVSVAADDSNRLTTDGSKSGAELLRKYVIGRAGAVDMAPTDSDGKTSAENLDLGLYLVVEKDFPETSTDGKTVTVAKPSVPFLVSIPMTNIATVTDANGEEHAAGTVWQYDIVVYPKNEMIVIRKDIVATGNDLIDATYNDDNGKVLKTDKNVGDNVEFVLTMDLPSLQQAADGVINTYRKYEINDTLTEGLEVRDGSADNFTVTVGVDEWNGSNETLTWGTDYTVDVADDMHSFKLDFTVEGLAKLDEYHSDAHVYVVYDATIASSAVITKSGAIKEDGNTYTLTFGTTHSEDVTFKSNEDIKTYTYEIDLTKEFTGTVTDKSVVTFTIKGLKAGSTNEYEDLLFVKEADGVYHLYDKTETNSDGTPVTDANKTIAVGKTGTLILKGLDARTYIFTEQTTAKGYNLMKDDLYVVLEKSYPEDGSLTSASITAGQDGTPLSITNGLATGQVCFIVNNNETIRVLKTGGEGWNTPAMVAVAGIAVLGAVALVVKHKKEALN